jgi:hypothetical protein
MNEATHSTSLQPTTTAEENTQQSVSAIRDGELVSLDWDDLTEAEKRAAYVVLFSPCDWL